MVSVSLKIFTKLNFLFYNSQFLSIVTGQAQLVNFLPLVNFLLWSVTEIPDRNQRFSVAVINHNLI